jgi:hypothetical protein
VSIMEPVWVKYIGTALPTGSATFTLFDSTVSFAAGSAMAPLGVHAYRLNVVHDQAGSVLGYRSDNRGTTWTQFYDSDTLAIPSAPDISDNLVVDIEGFKDVKFTWVNGGVTQTAFSVSQNLSPYP